MEALNHLLKANSKEVVVLVCNEAFLHRNAPNPPDEILQKTSKAFDTDAKETKELFGCLVSLVKAAIFQGSTEPAAIVKLFPEGFHKNLRDLLGKIIIEHLPTWKSHAVNGLVSLPRLLDFDWRVDVKTSAETVSRMSMPTCILQLQVQDAVMTTDTRPGDSSMNVELSKETLDTMLDGLGKIRNQLSSVADKS